MRIGPNTYVERGYVALCGRVWMPYLVTEAEAHVAESGCGPLRRCWVIVRAAGL